MMSWYCILPVSLSSQQETVECMHSKQNYGRCCDDDLNARVGLECVAVTTTINIKFYQKFGKLATETFQMMKQLYCDGALNRRFEYMWHRRFLQGRDNLEDDVRTGRSGSK